MYKSFFEQKYKIEYTKYKNKSLGSTTNDLFYIILLLAASFASLYFFLIVFFCQVISPML